MSLSGLVCTGSVWDLYGICTGSVQHGLCNNVSLSGVYGICTGSVRDLYRICTGSVRDLYNMVSVIM